MQIRLYEIDIIYETIKTVATIVMQIITVRYNNGDFVIVRVYISVVDRMCSSKWIWVNDELWIIDKMKIWVHKITQYACTCRTYIRSDIQYHIRNVGKKTEDWFSSSFSPDWLSVYVPTVELKLILLDERILLYSVIFLPSRKTRAFCCVNVLTFCDYVEH